MANEVKMITQLQDRLPECKVASDATIEKGTILALNDPNTGIASNLSSNVFLGIAAFEKGSADDSTTLSYWDNGIFDMKCDAVGVTVGDPVMIADGDNLIGLLNDATVAGLKKKIGIALQTGAGSEVIEVRVGK